MQCCSGDNFGDWPRTGQKTGSGKSALSFQLNRHKRPSVKQIHFPSLSLRRANHQAKQNLQLRVPTLNARHKSSQVGGQNCTEPINSLHFNKVIKRDPPTRELQHHSRNFPTFLMHNFRAQILATTKRHIRQLLLLLDRSCRDWNTNGALFYAVFMAQSKIWAILNHLHYYFKLNAKAAGSTKKT